MSESLIINEYILFWHPHKSSENIPSKIIPLLYKLSAIFLLKYPNNLIKVSKKLSTIVLFFKCLLKYVIKFSKNSEYINIKANDKSESIILTGVQTCALPIYYYKDITI